jgi:hypothetical protein
VDIIAIKKFPSGKKQQVVIDLHLDKKKKVKKGRWLRIKQFLKKLDPRPDFNFREGE